MRALEPEVQGSVEVDGVGIGYEVFGSGPGTILLTPAWAIVSSRYWKAQVPYLARRFRVITFDARGSGRSDRPEDPALYGRDVRDAVAVLDATGTERALVAGLSLGAATALYTAALHPDRVAGVIALAPTVPALTPDHPWWDEHPFDEDPGHGRGLGALHPRLVAPGLPGLRRVLVPRDVPGAPLREADRGLRRLGPRRRALGARAHEGLAGRRDDARAGGDSCCPASAARCSRSTAIATASRRSSAAGGSPS